MEQPRNINVRICAGQKAELQVLQTRPQEMRAPQRLVLCPSSDAMQTASLVGNNTTLHATDIRCCYEQQYILGRDAVQSAGILPAYRGKIFPL